MLHVIVIIPLKCLSLKRRSYLLYSSLFQEFLELILLGLIAFDTNNKLNWDHLQYDYLIKNLDNTSVTKDWKHFA